MRWVEHEYFDDQGRIRGWVSSYGLMWVRWAGVLAEPVTGLDREFCDTADEARAWVEFALPYYRITGEIPTPEVWHEHRKEVV